MDLKINATVVVEKKYNLHYHEHKKLFAGLVSPIVYTYILYYIYVYGRADAMSFLALLCPKFANAL